MALGERTALARLADRALIAELFESPEERVFAAVLQNPRLETDDLVRFVSVGNPDEARLTLLAEDPRWNRNPEIRGALFACRATPRAVAISLLTHGTRAEWRRVMEDPGADKLLAACARRLAENDGVDRPSRSL